MSNAQNQHKIVGNITITGIKSQERCNKIARDLQTYMNQMGITKIDAALDPFDKGPAQVSDNRMVISTQN